MIRPASPEDASEIAEFYVDIRIDSVPVVHSKDDVTEWLRTSMIPKNSSFVYVDDGKIAGWMAVEAGWLDQLYCRRGATGRGIGKLLLDFAKTVSPGGLKLYTFQVNDGARRFYAREGFVEVALGDGSENEEGQPDVLLEWHG